MKRKTQTYEQWLQLGIRLKMLRNLLMDYSTLFNGLPKTISRLYWEKTMGAFDSFKSKCEDRFALEHPKKFSTSVFYGPIEEKFERIKPQ